MKKSNFAAFFLMLAALCLTFIFTGCEEPVQVSFYTVTYESAHGTTPESITVPENTVLNEQQLPELEETGWKFKGWYEEEKPAKPGKYKVTKNVTLTALWASDLQVNYTSIFGTSPAKLTGFQKGYQLTSEDLPVLSDGIHTFVGWRNSVTGNLVDEGFAVNTAVTLEAVWKTCTVTFSNTGNTYILYAGDPVPVSYFDISEEEGKTFSYWKSNGSKITDTSSYRPYEDCTIEPVWEYNSYTISYNKNNTDASGTMTDSSAQYSQTFTLKTNSYSLTGYDFDGWNTKADGSGTSYDDKASITIPAYNITLYAQWTAKKYTVTFMPNGASGSSYTQKLPYNVPTQLTPNAFVREDYRFTEWNTDKYGYGTAYSDEETFTIGTSDVTLYARWKALDEYEITYQNIKDYSYTIYPKSYRYSVGASLRTISASGYDFEGWCFEADENGNGTGDVVTGWDAKDKSGDVVLYAKWSPKTDTKYTVVIYEENRDDSSFYEYSPKTYTGTTDQLTNVEPSEKEGFNLQQVEQQIIKGDGSTVVKVYYYRRIYTLTFDLNGGTGPENMQGKYQTSVDFDYPVWEGMTFTGWTIDDSSSLSTSKGYCFFEDATFKANWVKKTGVTVTIVQNDEDLTVTQSVEGNLVSIEVPEAYEVKLWRIDGVLQESKSNNLTIDTSELIKGVYAVYVKTTKDGKYYSAQINVEVE